MAPPDQDPLDDTSPDDEATTTDPPDDGLLADWTDLRACVEWVCHTGIGRFFAPWHAPTCDAYAQASRALHERVRAMGDRGAIVRARTVGLMAAVAAHALIHPARAPIERLGERDLALRTAFLPPASIRDAVLARVPAGPWPLPRYIPPPPFVPVPRG